MTERSWGDYSALFGLDSLRRRLKILLAAFANHRFERRSPIGPIDHQLLDEILSVDVRLPPRRHLSHPGMQSIEGLLFLASLARAIDAKTIFEIGTFTGGTTWTLAMNAPDATVHTLDIPVDSGAALALEESDRHRADPNLMLYRDQKEGARIKQHWADSARFDFSPFKGGMDLIVIDGAHSRDYVSADSRNALAMLSPKGAIVWDDYWRLSPGVTATLNEMHSSIPLFRVPQTRLVIHLPQASVDGLRGRSAT
ncbi:MAG: hypothetical protein QOF16_1481 [Actinomycetota bacterium]|nr:hypothetical protein [Actinomycetota bacterium]